MEGEINELLEGFFKKLKSEGMRAIAYCDNEKGRVTMLGIMEHAAELEVTLKKAIKGMSDKTIVITKEDTIDAGTLENLPAESKIIDTE
jgi:hypothetical protein